jgi:phage baseplate assembly protein W
MNGMDNLTGKSLADLAHLRQSIADILTTPIGSRVMRRDYGSRIFQRIDAPLTGELVAE